MIKPRKLRRSGKTVYDVRLRDPQGKVYNRTFASKREAEKFETTERAGRMQGAWLDPRRSARPLRVVAEEWLEADPTKRASSLDRDRSVLENHVFPILGRKAVGAVTRADVMKLVRSWSATHAPSSVVRMFATLRAVFSYAEAAEYRLDTPCKGVRLPRVDPVQRPEVDAEQLERLASELSGDQATMMWLGAVLGLRWAECAGLTVGAVDVLGHRLTVAAQLGRDGTLRPPKSAAGRRTMAVPEWLAEALAAVMVRRGLTAADPGALVFATAEGAPLHYSNWRRRTWVPACSRAGVVGLHFHGLRSLATTTLIAAGVDVKTTQHRLGHSSPQVTLALYARATEAADRKAADAIGAAFGPRDGRATVQGRLIVPGRRRAPDLPV
jgi:integrase